MHRLFELEQEFKDLDVLFDKALMTSSMSEKEEALEKFRASELDGITKAAMLVYAHEFGITARLIKITNTLPDQIEKLKQKVRLVEIQVNAEYTEDEHFEPQEQIMVPPVAAPTDTQPKASRVVAIERFKESLNPYIDTTSARTTEYSWGIIEYVGSFFGASGYSKTDKLDAITHLFEKLENSDNPVLSDKDKAVLTTGTLGTAVNLWMADPVIGEELTGLLTKDNTIENRL